MLPLQDTRRTAANPRRLHREAHGEPGHDRAARVEAAVSQRFAEFVDSGSSVPVFLARHPRLALQIVRDIRELPRLEAVLTAGAEAAAVEEQLMRNRTSRRFLSGVSAVLHVPAVPGTYLEGHERATVRRKIRGAAKKGVTVRPVPEPQRAALLALADRHEQQNERAEYRVAAPQNADLLDYDLWVAAYDGEDRPIALSVIPVAGEWATLRYFRTLVPGDASSDARYLMSQAVAEALCERGVRYLVDTARPHWLPNGLRHFQRMVGFRLVRVSPARVAG